MAIICMARGSIEQPIAHAATGRPSVVVIQVDDLSMRIFNGRIRERGISRPAMPTVRGKLSKAGRTFSRFYANNPICAPSRASLMTGLTTHNHGMLINASPFGYDTWRGTEREAQNLATWFSGAGYRTVHIGKFLNGYDEASAVPPGWDRWVTSTNNSGAPYYGHSLNIDGVVTEPIGSWRKPDPANCKVVTPERPNACTHSVDVHTAFAVEAIREAARLESPLFLQLDYNAPHDDGRRTSGPEAPGRLRGLARKVDLTRYRDDGKGMKAKPSILQGYRPLPRRQVREIRTRIRKEIVIMRMVDQSIGRILAALRESGQLDNTFVVFLSDNGFFAGEHRITYGKYLPYEAATRQPLIIRGPGIRPNSVSSAPASTIDVAPTLLEMAGERPPVPVDGVSMASKPDRSTGSRAVPLEGFNGRELSYPGPFTGGSGKSTKLNEALVTNYTGFVAGRWKYIYYHYGDQELYDLVRDPREYRNLARLPRYRKVVRWARGLSRSLGDCDGIACRPAVSIPPEP